MAIEIQQILDSTGAQLNLGPLRNSEESRNRLDRLAKAIGGLSPEQVAQHPDRRKPHPML